MNSDSNSIKAGRTLIDWRLAGKIVLAAMSYLFILVLIPLIVGKIRKNDFLLFHAKQGVALLLIYAFGIFSFYLPVLPILFKLILVFFVVIGIYNSIMQKMKPLPIIGRFAL